MLSIITLVLVAIVSFAFAYKRTLLFLKFLQQEQYYQGRFTSWLFSKLAFDRRGSLVSIVCGIFLLYFNNSPTLDASVTTLGIITLSLLTYIAPDPRVVGKPVLKVTERAKRIFQVSITIYSLLLILALMLSSQYGCAYIWLSQLILFQLIPFTLVAGNSLLSPAEKYLQDSFLNEARVHFAAVKPLTVGITGSYGKTSVKSILGELLGVTLGPTFWPPQGVNSLMGITAEIRGYLKPQHRYAVIEMGAYSKGSIKKLCNLCPPNVAIVTAVGTMHLERFGSVENIYQAKSELPQAVPSSGILVCNGDNPGARKMAEEFKKEKTFLYGINPESGKLDCWASEIEATLKGTKFKIHFNNQEYPCVTPLLGEAAVSNILAAFTTACALGAQPEFLIGAIRNLEPVDNRLALKQTDGVIYLNDAYNSNPLGFETALSVLKELPAKRRIIMTPGMIELGETQYSANRAVAELAGKVCDIALIVDQVNRKALLEGLKNSGVKEESIFITDTRDQAFKKLSELKQEGDVVLIENDLPDLYQEHLSL